LAGVAIYPVDNDDLMDACGKGSLIKTLYKTMTTLARKTRSAVLQSLIDPLEAANSLSLVPAAQTLQPVTISPFRIVRILDREGAVQVIRRGSQTQFECSRQGYFRHPQGCDR